jgi:uncharacterized membrane protein YjjP (DUF1212 family)
LGITLLLNSNKGGIFCVISTTCKNNRPGVLIMTALASLMFTNLFNGISRVRWTSICHLPTSSRMKQFLACINHKVLKLNITFSYLTSIFCVNFVWVWTLL